LSLKLVKLQRVVEEFRKLDSEMQLQTVLAFLLIAHKQSQGNTISIKEVGEMLGVTSASASRNVAALATINRSRQPGHELVVTYENPEFRVEKFIELTDKGKALVTRLENLVE
jgi:DNA-binding MarR family transcriptional regulator